MKIRVAANALDLVRRQVDAPAREAQAEHARLAAMLDREGTTEDLTRDLANRLRRGQGAAEFPALLSHLWATSLARIAVDQPRYASLATLPSQRRLGGSGRVDR